MSPLFLHYTADSVSLAPNLLTLLDHGAPSDLDHGALAVFLRLGFFIGDDTPFAALRALPPGATVEWENGRLRVQSSGYAIPPAIGIQRGAAIDAYIDLFRTAVARRAPSREFVVPLSGGQDSRHILLELESQGFRPRECVTLGYYPPREDGRERRIAATLASRVGVSHRILPPATPRLPAELQKNRITSFCADEHGWFMAVRNHLARSATRPLVYDGIAGGVFSAGAFLTDRRVQLARAGRFGELADDLLGSEGYLSRLVDKEFYRLVPRSGARERVILELKRVAGAANPVGTFFFWSRTRREIGLSPFALLADVADVETPFLDDDLFDFLAALPVDLVSDRKLHGDAIRRAYPRYADVPFDSEVAAGAHGRRRLRNVAAQATHFGQLAAEMAALALRGKHPMIRRGYLLTKTSLELFRSLGAELNRVMPMAVYLLQLDELVSAGA